MDIEQQAKDQMDKALAILRQDLGSIRAGHANPALVDHVRIKVYGGTTELSLSELATITTADSQTLLITPFDISVIDEIERGIGQANLGLTAHQDGGNIRLVVPKLTQERREEFVKLAKTKTEGVRVMIRQARQDAMTKIHKQEEDKDISEDQKFALEKQIQKLTDEHSDEADRLLAKKEKELITL